MAQQPNPPKKLTGIAKYIKVKSTKQDPKTKMIVMQYSFIWWKLGYWFELMKMTFTPQCNIIQTVEGKRLVEQHVKSQMKIPPKPTWTPKPDAQPPMEPQGKKLDV